MNGFCHWRDTLRGHAFQTKQLTRTGEKVERRAELCTYLTTYLGFVSLLALVKLLGYLGR